MSRTFWYKDFWTRTVILFNGLILIFLLNYFLYILLTDWDNIWFYLIAILLLWLSFWFIIRLMNWLFYDFEDDWIKIVLPNKKSHFLPKNDIVKIEKIDKIPFWYGIWIKYNIFTKDIMFTTSFKNWYRIIMNDWRSIIITPKKDEFVYSNFKSKLT